MANVYYLNQQPHPLWNILTDFGGQGLHMFSQQTPHSSAEHVNEHNHHRGRGQTTGQQTPQDSGAPHAPDNDNSRSSPRGPGLGEHGPRECEQAENTRDIPFRGRGCRRGGPGGRGGHPGHPWQGAWGAHRRQRHYRPGAGQSPVTPPEFVQQFLNNFSNQFGVDIGEVFNAINNNNNNNNTDGRSEDKEVDFVPRADVFDTATRYIIHASLPGAQKKDISVDYDTESSTLRLAGVVYRPDLDEELSNALVVDGRSLEVGVFEREIRLGSRDKPAHVDADNISAKLVDGVLVLSLPKVVVDRDTFRRRISVDQIRNDNYQVPEGEIGSANVNEGEEAEAEAEQPQAMLVDSVTEVSDEEDTGVKAGKRTPPSPSARSEEEEERDYVAVDVD
ncbi:hypothetical protein AJ78_01501 [Emergomyces pasteurianus Ep9510]|uniref:SHSP domain-containing protein n=1 Tax=Emergomyces pasteurianus Ep9510 TaxID=1447872 RepID=A0A1J9PPW4_9EURO|nr:hypothetical protein AJ78_01501 [Emergomyces pasteurianus Ep9510]